MTTRRFLAMAAGTAVATAVGPARAQTAQAPTSGEAAGIADFLFVQTARRMSFDRTANRLTLHDVSPVTLFFSDRPDRIAGNMRSVDAPGDGSDCPNKDGT